MNVKRGNGDGRRESRDESRELPPHSFSSESLDPGNLQGLERLGDYRIENEAGRGGMGIVYHARQISLDREVALKILPAGLLAEHEVVARFQREAQVTAGLHHPNIVEIYSMGVESGVPYYAMEFCEGETLYEKLRARVESDSSGLSSRLPSRLASFVAMTSRIFSSLTRHSRHAAPSSSPSSESEVDKDDSSLRDPGAKPDRQECLAIAERFVGVAKGLHHAHANGVVHRDLKPSNLMEDSDGRLRILDFGLAFIEGQVRLTQTDQKLGTPLYMSPEQAKPSLGRVGAPTDVYGLGATLYEVLTLTPPVQGSHYDEVLQKILHRDPIPPRRLNPRVPKDLETIVLKCLNKRPAERYATAEALAQDLRRVVRGDPIEARRLPLLERGAQQIWRARRRVAEVAVGAAFLLTLAILALQQWNELQRRARVTYEENVVSAVMMLLRKPLLATAGRRADLALERLSLADRTERPDLRFMRREGAYERWLEAGSEIFEAGLSLADAGPDPVEEAIEKLRTAASSLPDEPVAYYHLARALRLLDRPREAEEQLQNALDCDADFVPALALRASLLEQLGSSKAAVAAARVLAAGQSEGSWAEAWLRAHRATRERRWSDAVRAYESLLTAQRDGEDPYLGFRQETLLGRGLALVEAGELERAMVDFGAGRARASGAIEPTLLLAKTFYLNGNVSGAESYFDEVWEIAAEDRKDDAARVNASAYREFGVLDKALDWISKMRPGPARLFLRAEILRESGRLEEAVRMAREATELGPELAAAHLALANALLEAGETSLAKPEYALAARTSGRDVRPWIGLAKALEAEGELEQAEKAMARALDIDHGSVVAYLTQARLLSKQGRLDEAATSYENALRLAPDNAIAHNNLGTVLDRQGLPAQAVSHYREAAARRPELAFIHYNLALALHRQLDFLGAAEEYQSALRLGLDDVTIRSNLALSLHRVGRLPEAIGEYQAALEKDGESAVLHHALGVLYENRENLPEAISHYRKAVELQPDWPGAHNELGFAYDQTGQHEEAIEQYRRVFELDEKSIWAQNNHANLVLRTNRSSPEGDALPEEIRRLELASRLPNAHPAVSTLRDQYRRELSPRLGSYASVDNEVEARMTLVGIDSSWQILRCGPANLPEASWKDIEFDAGDWREGTRELVEITDPARDEATGDAPTSLFLRSSFHLPEAAAVERLFLRTRVVDGCAVYVNGTEVGRIWAGPPDAGVLLDARADDYEDEFWVDRRMEVAAGPFLRDGDNLLAVQILSYPGNTAGARGAVVLEARLDFDRGGRERAEENLESYGAVAREAVDSVKLAYFEGRILQRAGSLDAAEQKFRDIWKADTRQPEPVLRIAECLSARGEYDDAATMLLDAISTRLQRSDLLWDAWIQAALVEGGRTPAEMLAELPLSHLELSPREHPADIVWLLERLAVGEALRIRCGGEGVLLEGTGRWSRDRFFRTGTAYQLTKLENLQEKPPEFALYTTERFFYEPTGRVAGYRIPLPRDEYRVTVRFTEGHFIDLGSRIFDVIVEGQRFVASCEPLAKGFGQPDVHSRVFDVIDGVLDIDFQSVVQNPKISALEIERL